MAQPSLPLARIEHQLAGRLRLRVPARRRDVKFFGGVTAALREAPGLRRLAANPRTGGILIEHDGDVGAIAAFARERGLFELAPPSRPSGHPRNRPEIVRSAWRPLGLAAAGFAGLGAYQALRGRLLGNAAEHLWHAYGAYSVLGMPRLALGLAGIGLYRLAGGPIIGPAATLMFHALTARAMAARTNGAGMGPGRAGPS